MSKVINIKFGLLVLSILAIMAMGMANAVAPNAVNATYNVTSNAPTVVNLANSNTTVTLSSTSIRALPAKLTVSYVTNTIVGPTALKPLQVINLTLCVGPTVFSTCTPPPQSNSNITTTVKYELTCSINQNSLAVYEWMPNAYSWAKIPSSYEVGPSACWISYNVPADPVVGVFQSILQISLNTSLNTGFNITSTAPVILNISNSSTTLKVRSSAVQKFAARAVVSSVVATNAANCPTNAVCVVPPNAYTPISVFNYTLCVGPTPFTSCNAVNANTNANVTTNATVKYSCSISPSAVAVYEYSSTSGAWTKLASTTTVGPTACWVSFNVPSDPVVGVFAQSSAWFNASYNLTSTSPIVANITSNASVTVTSTSNQKLGARIFASSVIGANPSQCPTNAVCVTPPSAYAPISIFNYTLCVGPTPFTSCNAFNVNANVTTRATVKYSCNIQTSAIAVYELTSGSAAGPNVWSQLVTNFSVGPNACTVSFTVPPDPVVGVFQYEGSNTTTVAATTSIYYQTTAPTTIPTNSSGVAYPLTTQSGSSTTILVIVVIVIIILLIAIYALSKRKK
ncbi:MAG: hypothetical protein ABR981_02775 [Candidatus Micrarchaeaceae archaeon]|jgi:hypothetical protein